MKIQIQNNVPLASKTTLRIGGNALYYVKPETEDEIIESIAWSCEKGLAPLILGRGSNMLVSDGGWQGLVIDTSGFCRVEWNDSVATCQAGAPLIVLIREMIERGFCGLEFLNGIPGSIGGATLMNAGSYGHCVSECIISISYYDFTNKKITGIPAKGLMPGYRHTFFSDKQAFILSVKFEFTEDMSGSAMPAALECMEKRRAKHPLDLPNCGSVFKNLPGGIPAASVIEAAGLKGTRLGDVCVSDKHANFIVNKGHGKAGDVRCLIAYIQKIVYEEKNVVLEPEVVFAGEFDCQLFKP
jgi:UDP-N-acetylmuramate dehydrogenase